MSHLGVLTSPLTSTHTQTKIEKTAHLYRTLRFSCRKPCSPAIGEIYLFWKPQSAIWHFENETFHITSDITCLVQRSSLTLNIGEMEKMKGRMTETSLIEHIPYFWPATFRVKRIALEKEIWPSSVADQHLLFRPVFINYTILPQGGSRRHASIPSSTPQALIAKYCPALPLPCRSCSLTLSVSLSNKYRNKYLKINNGLDESININIKCILRYSLSWEKNFQETGRLFFFFLNPALHELLLWSCGYNWAGSIEVRTSWSKPNK